MYVVLETNPDTSGGSAYYQYLRSFNDKDAAREYASLLREEAVAVDKSWAPHYHVFQKV